MHQGGTSTTTLSESVPHASLSVREAIGIRRSVPAFQPKLVRAEPIELDEKPFVQLHAAIWMRVDLYHPAFHSIGIELVVPWRVKRIGEIDTLPIAAKFDHLRPAIELLLRLH